MNSYDDMNYMEMDVIKEVGSIGTGNAASALSGMYKGPYGASPGECAGF